MILVTGGAGFIGSHTCVELLGAGYDVAIVDNFSNADTDVPRRIGIAAGRTCTVYACDLSDTERLRELFRKQPVDAVIHFAALKAVGESVARPLAYYDNNVGGTLSLLKVMSECGCKKLVFSSSATVYGSENPVPYTETQPLGSATNPYGTTKIMLEKIFTDLCASDGEWSIISLRYFNPLGGHASGLLGDDPSGIPNNLLPYVVRVAGGKLPCLHIYGNDYDTPDGTGQRDYIHVVDLALGHVSALHYLEKHRGMEAFNLGTGRAYSVLEVVKAFERVNHIDIPYVMAPRREGDLPAFYADAGKAERLLGWKATRSLEDMCRDAWSFAKGGS